MLRCWNVVSEYIGSHFKGRDHISTYPQIPFTVTSTHSGPFLTPHNYSTVVCFAALLSLELALHLRSVLFELGH